LIVCDLIGVANRERLPVRFSCKCIGSNIRNPDLDKSKALFSHTLAMRSNSIPDSHSVNVTCNGFDGKRYARGSRFGVPSNYPIFGHILDTLDRKQGDLSPHQETQIPRK
jgi:hypothetical protein